MLENINMLAFRPDEVWSNRNEPAAPISCADASDSLVQAQEREVELLLRRGRTLPASFGVSVTRVRNKPIRFNQLYRCAFDFRLIVKITNYFRPIQVRACLNYMKIR